MIKKDAPPIRPRDTHAGDEQHSVSKTGVRQLSGAEDLYAVFSGEPAPAPDEDFETLLEQSLAAKDREALLQEKWSAAFPGEPAPVREQLKTYPPPQEELDLHGCTAEEAVHRTDFFISDARVRGLQTVRIIVGKGIHSPGKAILPDAVENRIVAFKKKEEVLTFAWEHRAKRSSGALLVYLKTAPR